MKVRNVFGLTILALAAAGSWYLASSLREPEVDAVPQKTFSDGFYLKAARILGTDDQGSMLYEIDAAYAEEKDDGKIEFQNVRIRYSPEAQIPWTVNADSAVIAATGEDQDRVELSGHVRAVSSAGIAGKVTEIRTPYLEVEPKRFRAETDQRVQIRIGEQRLAATGMLALLQENRLLLKSNVSGKYFP